MLITRTPLRISFAGGGTDFRSFYRQHGGTVLCSAIDKYVHVILQNRYDDKIRIGYSTTELCDGLDDVQHELVRESMRQTRLEQGIEISTMADIPSTGSGLGSSSSVTVGLLNAFHTHLDDPKTKETLAREAVEIEVDVLQKPIGKQDQYIAAYGGLRKIEFAQDDDVRIEQVAVSPDTLRELDDNLMLFYTGMGRDSASVLSEQKKRIAQNGTTLVEMARMAHEMEAYLVSGQLDDFGKALDYCWSLKKGLASNITNSLIDDLYSSAREAGALGAKIAGAGGGGFFLVYCERSRQSAVRNALAGLEELEFRLEPEGSKVLFST